MVKTKICPFVDSEGVECKEEVSSQGLWSHLKVHLKDHPQMVEEIHKLMKVAEYVPEPEKGSPPLPEPKHVQTPPKPPDGEIEPKIEPLEQLDRPTLPEEQMIEEMATRLRADLTDLPRGSKPTIDYVIGRFKNEPSLQEDPYQLHNVVNLANPQAVPLLITALITNVFKIRDKYNIDRMNLIRTMPAYSFYSKDQNPDITGLPTYNSQGSIPPYLQQFSNLSGNLQQQGFPQGPPPQNIQNPEIKSLVDEVKELKSEMTKKEEDSKHKEELAQQDRQHKESLDEQKKNFEAMEKRHQEQMEKFEKLLEGTKEKEKYVEMESQLGSLNAKLDTSITGIKDLFTEVMVKQTEKDHQRALSDKERDHNQKLSDLERKIESATKDKGSEMDYFEKHTQFDEKIKNIAESKGYTVDGKKDMKTEFFSKGTEILDKVTEAVLSDDNKEFSAPPSTEFKPVNSSAMERLKKKAIEKTEQQIVEKEAEVAKMEQENLKLKKVEEMAIKKAQENSTAEELKPPIDPPSTSPPPSPESKESPESKVNPPPNYDKMKYNDIQKIAKEKGFKVVGKGITREKLISDLKKLPTEGS